VVIVELFHAFERRRGTACSGRWRRLFGAEDGALTRKTTPSAQWTPKPKHFSRPITREESSRSRSPADFVVRDPTRPDELFAVTGKLAELLGLDPELFRDRLVFPRQDEMSRKVLRWRLEPEKGAAIEVFRPDLNSTPVAEKGTDASMVPKLTPAAAALYGAPCEPASS
jgi:hypothetical protein